MKLLKKYLKASWPAIGGKASVASLVWERFGKVDNYIEPFCNSAAMALKNPHGPAHYETLNDLNCFVANYWRSVKMAPDLVAEHSDWPVSEVDLHARHAYLMGMSEEAHLFRIKMTTSPEFYDPKFAGWWAWGSCLWIGSGWCSRLAGGQRPDLAGGYAMNNHRPQLADAHSRGRGVHSNDSANTCDERRAWLREWMQTLSNRLRNTRVCCGDWKRVCGSKSVTTRLGLTGVFLDQPYRVKVKGKKSRAAGLYATDEDGDLDKLQKSVLAYGVKHGSNPRMRIAICGLEGEGFEPLVESGWTEVQWQSQGYGARTKKGQANAARERIWFSPHCVDPARDLHPLFAGLAD